MGFLLNGVTTGGFPIDLVKLLTEFVDIPNFVETGTAGGESVKAASCLFKNCYTIELIKGRCESMPGYNNIEFYIGNSVDILPKIISKLNKNSYTFFWLDAHYSDPTPNTSEFKECYIIEEIKAIRELYGERAIIFIDDARLFYGHPPAPNDPRDWPTIGEIFKELNKFEFHINTVRDDYILSYPDTVQDPINEEWRSRYNVRYPSTEDKLKMDAKNVFLAVKKYLGV